jgi:putative nucleotidyltransferase with HDIG domain
LAGRIRTLGVGTKVVAPFVGLTLLLGLVVSAVAGQELAVLGGQQQMLLATRAEDNVNTVFNSVEERQLAELRLFSAAPGLSDAVAAADSTRLRALLFPQVAEQLPIRTTLVVVDDASRQQLALSADPQQPDRCLCAAGGGIAAFQHLDDVLASRADRFGSRYFGLAPWIGTRLLFTVGPILDRAGNVVGALVVGERLDAILAEVEQKAGVPVAAFASDRTELGRSGSIGPRSSGGATQLVHVPWLLRFQPQGYLVLALPTGAAAGGKATLLFILLGVWLAALVLTLAAGAFISRSITRPLGSILEATRQVAAGNLQHRAPVESGDEIGRVADSFNGMIEVLGERSGRLARQHEDTLLALAAALDTRDPYTHGHSVRVAVYSATLAAAAGLGLADLDALERGCLVHDIGKIGVPDQLLLKPGRLSAQEQEEMRRHPVVGHQMLTGLGWPEDVYDIVRHHHERWDGAGYPAGLAGEGIPVLARVVAVADTLDAMTSHRPYRPAFSYRLAAAEIARQAAIQFDPELVAAFRRADDELGDLVVLMSGDQQMAEYLESAPARKPTRVARAPRLRVAS